MTKTAKVWTGVLIVAAVVAGAIVANNMRTDQAATTTMVSETPAVDTTANATPASTRAWPMPVDKKAEAGPTLVVSTELAQVVKPLLQPGTDLTMASDGFASSEAFVATAYASKNLNVPFVLLKDRVTVQHMSLAKAIGDVKPTANAKIEADRAQAEARAELARSGLN